MSAAPIGFAQEHIPGAINIQLPDLTGTDRRLVSGNGIVVYSSGAGDYLGVASAKRLLSLGYSEVYVFSDGLAGWKTHPPPGDGSDDASDPANTPPRP